MLEHGYCQYIVSQYIVTVSTNLLFWQTRGQLKELRYCYCESNNTTVLLL